MPSRTSGKKKVIIVGFCQTSRDWVDYNDPDAEIWGLNRGRIFMPTASRWFDLHSPEIRHWQQRRPGQHIDFLKTFPGPVYLHQAEDDIPNSVTYPRAEMGELAGHLLFRVNEKGEISETVDRPYLTSSIADQIALAISEGFDEIHLRGIDLDTESEYFKQKPAVEAWLYFAMGRGIKVVLPDNCPLCQGPDYGRAYLNPDGEHLSYGQLEERQHALERQQVNIAQQMNELLGAREENEFLASQIVPNLNHEHTQERLQQIVKTLGKVELADAENTGSLAETLALIQRKQVARRNDLVQKIQQHSGRMKEITFAISDMPPGLDQERLEDRRKGMNEMMNQLQMQLHQTHGKIKELAYWIHQTPDGGDEQSVRYQDGEPSEGEKGVLAVLSDPEPVLEGAA